MMPRRRLAPCLLLPALLAAWGCAGDPPPVEPELRPVRTYTVTREASAVERTLAGVAQAAVESNLSFRVEGIVEEVAVAVGDVVKRGQLLARLDPTDYELRVEEAEAALAQGAAGLRRAEADYDRMRSLYENNNASKSDLDAARAGAESAQAQVDAARKRLAQTRQQLGYAVLRAPFDGAVAAVDVEPNENVKSGKRLVLLTGGGPLEVAVVVPEVMIALVAVGQPVEVRFDALPSRAFAGHLAEVGVAATGSASTFDAIARLDESDTRIRAGMAAEVTFRIEQTDRRRTVVPSVAVGEDRLGRFVLVVEPGEGDEAVVRRRPVIIGPPSEGLLGIEILEGLAEGEEVVTAGVRRLSDGARVRRLAAGGAD